MSDYKPRHLKKFKRTTRVFANYTTPESHYLIDMAELTNMELGTVVRELSLAAIKLLLNRRKQHAAAGDYLMACLGRGVKFVDFEQLNSKNNKKRGGSNGVLLEENSGNDGRMVGSVPDHERVRTDNNETGVEL